MQKYLPFILYYGSAYKVLCDNAIVYTCNVRLSRVLPENEMPPQHLCARCQTYIGEKERERERERNRENPAGTYRLCQEITEKN